MEATEDEQVEALKRRRRGLASVVTSAGNEWTVKSFLVFPDRLIEPDEEKGRVINKSINQ